MQNSCDDNEESLDKQTKGSLIYVALGSEVTIDPSEISELANGMELSGLPFFGVLRKPLNSRDMDYIGLPNGFEERIY